MEQPPIAASKLRVALLAMVACAGCDEVGQILGNDPSSASKAQIVEVENASEEHNEVESEPDSGREAESTSEAASPRVENVIGPCEEIIIPTHFGLGWETLNHRIGRFEARLANATECTPDSVRLELRGGGFSNGRFFLDDAWGVAGARHIRREGLAAGKFTIVDVVAGGTAEGEVTIPREGLRLPDGGSLHAVLGGVAFDTADAPQPEEIEATGYNVAMGYTLRGLGAGVRVKESGADDITVAYWAQFQPGAAPDRPRHNRAMGHARVAAEIDVILLAVPDVDAKDLQHAYSVSYVRPGIGNLEQPPPGAELTTFEAEGRAQAGRGFVGIRDFRFELAFGKPCTNDDDCSSGPCVESIGRCAGKFGPAGDYLQSVLVSTAVQDYDALTGEASIEVLGHVSNSSEGIAFRPLDYEFATNVLWLQVDGVTRLGPTRGKLEKGAVALPLER